MAGLVAKYMAVLSFDTVVASILLKRRLSLSPKVLWGQVEHEEGNPRWM